jgi:hypothetical protein
MGHRQVEQAALFYAFSLEKHVPSDHLLRSIDRFIELGELRRELAAFYSTMGRPSIDPDLMIRMLGRKVSDEFTVPLCRGHHRELHRCGDEVAWWRKAGIDPSINARSLWLETHPLPTTSDKTSIEGSTSVIVDTSDS